MLSGYAYFPPIETVITPRFGASVKSGAFPQRRRQAKSRLGPHTFLVYPPPPAVDPVETTLRPRLAVGASLAAQRRAPVSVLAPARYVAYPIIGPVEGELRVALVAVRASLSPQRREPSSVLRPHVGVVYPLPPSADLDTTRQRPRLRAVQTGVMARLPRTTFLLTPPAVIGPPVGGPAMGGIMVVLAPSPRSTMLPMHSFPGPVVVNP